MKTWVLPYIKFYKGRMGLNIFFAILGIGSGAMLLFISGYLISKTALRPENILLVYVPIVAVRAFSIAQATFPYLEKLVGHHVVLKILSRYRNKLYDILEPQALILRSRYQSGDLLGVLADDIEKLQDFYIRTLFPAVTGVVIYAGIVAVFGVFDLRFMLLMLAILGIMLFLIPLLSFVVMRQRQIDMKQKRATLYQRVTDALFGQIDWMVSGRVMGLFEQTDHDNQALLQAERHIQRWHHVRDLLLRFLSGMAIILVMIWVNSEVHASAMSATVIAAFVLMMFSITDALIPVASAVEEAPAYRESIRRMDQITTNRQPLTHGDRQHVKESSEVSEQTKETMLTAHPTIHVHDVCFQYPADDERVLDHLNLVINPGEKLALLGKSGTGKSTLLKLLAGVMSPNEGCVRLDTTLMTADVLADKVSVLNQDPHLFNTTIANNIRIGRENATDQDIKAVLRQVQMLEMIELLPKGIHTQMEEMGKRFSGGERHRIAFARLLIQETPIILLDEPTTGLDPITEHALLTTMLAAAKDKTVILITHHLASAKLMDKLIFLENGQIKRAGSHQQLLAKSDVYRRLYAMDTGMNG